MKLTTPVLSAAAGLLAACATQKGLPDAVPDAFLAHPQQGFRVAVDAVPGSDNHAITYRRINKTDTTTLSLFVRNAGDHVLHTPKIYRLFLTTATASHRATFSVGAGVAHITHLDRQTGARRHQDFLDPDQVEAMADDAFAQVFPAQQKPLRL